MTEPTEVTGNQTPLPRNKSRNQGLVMMAIAPLIAIGPFLIGWPLAELFCPQPANEGNCSWAALPWMCFLTIPVGIVLFFVGFISALVSAAKKKPE